MKQYIFFCYLSLFFPCYSYYSSYQKVTSRGYLKNRNLQNYSFVLGETQFFDPTGREALSSHFRIVLIPLGTVSTGTPELGDAFTINRKGAMLIAGDSSSAKEDRDIRAEWLGGSAMLNGLMSFVTDQYNYGIKFLAQIPLPFLADTFLSQWLISVRGILANPTQRMSLKLTNDIPDDQQKIITDFFSNTPQAKITGTYQSNPGFESIAVSIDGLYKNRGESLHIYYYGGVEIPTQITYESDTLFYPILGNNGTLAMLLGVSAHGMLYEGSTYGMGLLFELEDHFPLYRTVTRTFDLYGKPLSRYLPTIDPVTGEKLPTVATVSSLPCRIHSCNDLDLSGGLLFSKKNENSVSYISLGYNIFVANSEYSELRDRNYKEQYDIFQEFALPGMLPKTTASHSTMEKRAEDDPLIKKFTINDLDLASVAATGGYTNTIFARIECLGETSMVTAGVWKEWGIKNSSYILPSRYGAWIGIGATW